MVKKVEEGKERGPCGTLAGIPKGLQDRVSMIIIHFHVLLYPLEPLTPHFLVL